MADIYKHSIWKEILITQLNIYDMEAEDINYKEQDRNAILAYLAGGKCTQVEDIIKYSGANKLRVYTILFELEQEDKIVVMNTEKFGSPKAVKLL